MGRYDNPITIRFLVPLPPTQPGGIGSLESILGLLKSLKIRALIVGEKHVLGELIVAQEVTLAAIITKPLLALCDDTLVFIVTSMD